MERWRPSESIHSHVHVRALHCTPAAVLSKKWFASTACSATASSGLSARRRRIPPAQQRLRAEHVACHLVRYPKEMLYPPGAGLSGSEARRLPGRATLRTQPSSWPVMHFGLNQLLGSLGHEASNQRVVVARNGDRSEVYASRRSGPYTQTRSWRMEKFPWLWDRRNATLCSVHRGCYVAISLFLEVIHVYWNLCLQFDFFLPTNRCLQLDGRFRHCLPLNHQSICIDWTAFFSGTTRLSSGQATVNQRGAFALWVHIWWKFDVSHCFCKIPRVFF
jgi:hypothetical protein